MQLNFVAHKFFFLCIPQPFVDWTSSFVAFGCLKSHLCLTTWTAVAHLLLGRTCIPNRPWWLSRLSHLHHLLLPALHLRFLSLPPFFPYILLLPSVHPRWDSCQDCLGPFSRMSALQHLCRLMGLRPMLDQQVPVRHRTLLKPVACRQAHVRPPTASPTLPLLRPLPFPKIGLRITTTWICDAALAICLAPASLPRQPGPGKKALLASLLCSCIPPTCCIKA